jgi:hypothetical protein
VASLIGGVFNYAGDTVGAIVRVSYPGKAPSAALRPATRTDAQLLGEIVSINSVHRLWAQREILHRGAKPATIARLQQYALDRQRAPEARASAMFTLKLLAGARANAAIQRIAAEPAMRELALHVLTDDKRQLAGVPVALYVSALNDADLAVRAAALNGLVRLDARDRAESIVPLLTSPDSALAHLAVQALVSLGARDVALRALTAAGSSPELRTRARFVLQQMHDAETVSALLAANGNAGDPMAKREVVAALARLYNTEGPWKGEWWGTHPSTVGPYFTPVTWEESARIKPVLRQTMLAETGGDFNAVVDLYAKNRVLPMGAKALFSAVATSPAATQRDALVDALVGTSQLTAAAVPLVARLDATSPALHAAVAELLAGETAFEGPALALARTAVLDTTLAGATRAKVLTALSAVGDAGRDATTEIFARLTPRAGAPPGATDPIEAAWRRWVGERLRSGQLDYFVNLARTTQDPAQRTLAYAVLLQVARNQRAPAAIREQVTPVLDAAWSDAALTPRLVDAIAIMRVESQYQQQLDAYKAKQGK